MKELKEVSVDFDETLFDGSLSVDAINHYIYCHGKREYEINVFGCLFDNEDQLTNEYEAINNIIASEFQSAVLDNIEKWNIYLFYFVKENVSQIVKSSIEQNKYSTRKIVISNFNEADTVNIQKEMIINKLFKLEVDNSRNESTIINSFSDSISITGDIMSLVQKLDDIKEEKEKKKKIDLFLREG